jgi:uncharacterized protein YjiS (DUF1127 family)
MLHCNIRAKGGRRSRTILCRVNWETRFDISLRKELEMYAFQDERSGTAIRYPTPEEIEWHVARGRQMQAEAIAARVRRTGAAGRDLIRQLGGVLRRRRCEWVTREQLAALGDRALADIGIPRQAIPYVARGIQWHDRDLSETAWQRRRRHASVWLAAWRERRQRQHAIYRELMAYSDRELDELKVFRSDIRRIASAA